jgi:peptidylprolyl isomerase
VAIVLAALLLGACGGGGDSSTTFAADTTGRPAAATSPAIHVPSGPPPRHLVIKDTVKGRGAAVPPIARPAEVKIRALYKTAEYKTGTVLDDRWSNPFDFEFEPGAVVPAWEKGIVGMKVGGRRELIAPSGLAYGDGARIFLVQLVSVKKIPHPNPSDNGRGSSEAASASRPQGSTGSRQAKAPPHRLTIARRSGPPPRHIKVIDLRKGTGATVTKGDSVRVRYFSVEYPEVLKRARSGVFGPNEYGLDETVKGWTVGLPGMKVGGRRELVLPPPLVFPRWRPSWGYMPYVRIYVIDLLGVKPD